MNKSLVTNVLSAVIAIAGYFSPVARGPILFTGLFAFSGAITNWIAIYMLFERVPFLYGSGVIPLRFEEFKRGIHGLIMGQFFTKENVARLLASKDLSNAASFDVSALKAAIDYERVFQKIVEAALATPMGGMLGMFGGAKVLSGLKAPVERVVRESVDDVLASDAVKAALSAGAGSAEALAEKLIPQVDSIVQARLSELTPDEVKRIVQEMIREHLGWLVVWGGVFGGLIGLVGALLA